MILNPSRAWIRQLAALIVVLLVWEAAGKANLLNPLYMPSPSRIAGALTELFASGRIWPHLEATFAAALAGLVLGSNRSGGTVSLMVGPS
jgi:NitT/TauT family transport system permease protein